MIYIDDDIEGFDLQEALASVSDDRREQALRYRQERDQRLCVAAYRLLQRALLQQYGIVGLPQLIRDEAGKPRLSGHPNIHFSLSHCHDAVACVVSDQPVGIDIETLDHYSQEVSAQVMNREEVQFITSSPHPATAFTRLWTMKESLFKLTGDNNAGDIAGMLNDVSRYDFTTIIQPRYICTCCRYKS